MNLKNGLKRYLNLLNQKLQNNMDNQIKELVEEIERRKSDLVFLRSTEARIRKEIYGELLEWIKERWTS